MVSHRTRKQGAGTRTAAVATSRAKAKASVRKDAQKGIPIRGAPLERLRASFALNQHPSVDQKAAICREFEMYVASLIMTLLVHLTDYIQEEDEARYLVR